MKIQSGWQYIVKNVPSFPPLGKKKLAWDLMMLILIFWHLISLSLLISFDTEPWQSFNLAFTIFPSEEYFVFFQILCALLFLFDILIKFNTGCFESGIVIYEKNKIVRRYLRDGLLYDFLGLVPFFVYFSKNSEERNKNYLLYFFLFIFKLRPLYHFLNNIKEGLLSFEGKKEAIYLLLKLISQVFMICHFGACLWHFTALQTYSGQSWITALKLGQLSWEEKYLKAIYYVVVTMTTTGYGDITPQNHNETFLSITFMFIGSVLVGFSINSIRDILKSANADSKIARFIKNIILFFFKC